MPRDKWLGSMIPPGAEPDGRGPAGDMSDEGRGGGAGDAGHPVVLGEPETVEAPALGVLSDVEGAE
jgi:hypothetical protein